MIKNLGTAKLLGILAVLVLIYIGFEFFGGKGRSENYREVLVEIDTANVDKIVIQKGSDTLKVEKQDGEWQVKIGDNKFAKATTSSVRGTLNTLLSIEASRIMANKEDQWKEYQVDTTGTRVKIFEGDSKSLDIIIGRLGFQGQRQYSTYVRLAEENEVYAAANFMGAAINTDPAGYRNSQVARIDKDSVLAIAFHYPDSSFTLVKDSLNWLLNDVVADSSATAQFLNNFSYLNSSRFYDGSRPSGAPLLTAAIKTAGKTIEIKAWELPEKGWVVQSTHNPESYFLDNDLFEKVFKGEAFFAVE